MADLKVGTTVGGSPVWHQGNLALVPSGNAILYKGARIYSENDKPSANELQVVSRAGDTMTGVLNVETSTEYPLALKSSVSGPAYIRFSKGNTLQSYVGTDAAGDFKVAMTDTNGSWAFDGLKIAKSNGDVSLKGALVSTNTGNFDIKYGNVQFIRANSSKHLYIGAPGGTDLVLGYAQDGMTTTRIRFDSAVYNKTGGLLISDTGLIQRSAMDNPYYNQTESDARFVRLNVDTATSGYLLSKTANIASPNNLIMRYSGFFRHNMDGGFRDLTINVGHPFASNGAHARGITFDYGSAGYGMYTYAYDSAGNKLANQKIYTEADKPTPAEIGALAAGANAVSASKLQTARTISLTGGATGSVSFDGSANVSLAVTVTNDSHTHSDYVKKIGDTMSGNLTVPRVLLSAAQGTEANAVARRDFVESTVTASGKGVKDLTIALPAGAPTSGYIPVLFETYVTSNSFVFIDTLRSGSAHPMNNCSFLGNVRASGSTDRGSYAVGQFTIYSESERAIHSIHRPTETINGYVVYVETRAFPITVRVDIETAVTAYATDVTYGTSVFKVDGQVSGNTKTIVLANFDKGSGTYSGSNRVYDNGYNPTPEAVGALPVNGNAVTASRLQTARLIAGVPFDGTSNISISAANVGAVAKAGDTMTGTLGVTKINHVNLPSDNQQLINAHNTGIVFVGNAQTVNDLRLQTSNGVASVTIVDTPYRIYHAGFKPTAIDVNAVGRSSVGSSSVNLNALRTAQHLRLEAVGNITNRPSDDVGYAQMIHVNGGGDTHMQILGTYNTGKLFWRGFNNAMADGSVSWHQIYHTGFKPTPGDVGAVAKAGDTMSGNLTAPAVLVSSTQNTSSNALTRKDYVDSAIAAGDALQVSKSGDTMTGELQSSARITGTGTAATDYSGAGLMANGGAAGYPSIAFHQPGLFGGDIVYDGTMYTFHTNNHENVATVNTWETFAQSQPTRPSSLTRKDYVDGQVATRAPMAHTHTVAAITDLNPQDANATANTLALRDGSADVNARLLRTTYGDESAMSGAIAFRVNNSTNNYTRYCNNPESVRNWMKGAKTDWRMDWRAYIEHADNPMTEYHIPGMTAVITYLTPDGNYRITTSNGIGGAVADRLRLDSSGNLFAMGAIHEAAQRVYSPNNQPHYSHNHTIANVDGLQTALDGKSATSHTHTAADVGAVAKTGDTMTGNLFAPAVLVSSAQDASPNALTRKDYVDAKVGAVGLVQGGSGLGGTSVTFSTVGKTMAVAYLAANGRVYPVTFAIASAVQHGVNVPNRGGENADKDYDLRVAVSVSGNNMTLTTIAGNRCNGIWQVYTM